jgi:hypothetical protein
VTSAVLVSSPQTLNADMNEFNGALAGYQFVALGFAWLACLPPEARNGRS